MADREIVTDLIGRDRMSPAFESAARSSEKMRGHVDKLSGLLKGALVGGAAVAGVAALSVGKTLFDAAGRVELLGNKARTVFGPSFASVAKAADGLNERLGISKVETEGLLAGFGDLLTPMGFTTSQAASMSSQLGTLTGALTAWSGGTKTSSDVADMLNDALTGEYDSLKSLGVQIDADTIKQELHRTGKDKLTGAALKQAQAEAAVRLITQQSSNALTAYNQHTNKLADSKAALAAKIADVRDTLAAKLLPVFVRLGSWLVDSGIPAVQRLWEGLSARLGPVFAWIGTTIVPKITATFASLKKTFDDNREGFAQGQRVVNALGMIFKAVLGPAIQHLVDYELVKIKVGFQVFSFVLTRIVVPAIKGILSVFLTVVGGILTGAAKAFGWVPGVGDKLKKAASDFSHFRDSVNASLDGIRKSYTVAVNLRTVRVDPSGATHVQTIRAMAKGGIVNRPTVALIGEAGPEAVVPLKNGGGAGLGPSIVIENLNVSAPLASPEEVARAVVNAVQVATRRGYRPPAGWAAS